MDQIPKRRNPISRFFNMLLEARWFFTFSASSCATIVGISLTFGINSCRESSRIKREMEKSIIQASENLLERLDEADKWLAVINRENRVYEITDSLLTVTGEVPDSVSTVFYNTFPYIRLSAFDHEFEKIFRGSYQFWQLHNSNDSLKYYLSQCYDGLNIVETTCQSLTEGILEEIGTINATTNFYRIPPKMWTRTLVSDPRFQYFMSVRMVKTDIAASILSQVNDDYQRHIAPSIERLKK